MPYTCSACGKKFGSKSRWETHQEEEHRPVEDPAPFQCPHCNFVAANNTGLAAHVRGKHKRPVVKVVPDYVEEVAVAPSNGNHPIISSVAGQVMALIGALENRQAELELQLQQLQVAQVELELTKRQLAIARQMQDA